MIIFPLTVNVTKTFKTPNSYEKIKDEMKASIYDELLKLKPSKITIEDDSIKFTGGILRTRDSLNLLNPITKGQVDIIEIENEISVHYTLDSPQSFIISTVMAAFLTLVFLSIQHFKFDFSVLYIFLGCLLWFYGGNLVVCLLKFNHLINRVISKLTHG